MKIHLINTGCKVNFADLSQVRVLLVSSGHTIVSDVAVADVVLVNTCAVTNQSAAQSRQIIRRVRAQNRVAFIGVLGCYAQVAADDIIAQTGADAVFGTNEKFKIHLLLEDLLLTKSKQLFVSALDNPAFHASSSVDNKSRTRAFLKLQDGCNYKCSYCIVPFARGSSRSIPFSQIPAQINKLLAANYKEIVVSGINLSDYQGENGERFIDLLTLLSNIDKHCDINNTTEIRFRISSIEPQVLDSTAISLIASSKYICPHFHVPLQSGSDNVLRKMQRRYSTAQFRESIELINKHLPQAFIGLDVISGFPTETAVDFNITKDFINSLHISALHCFTYSAKAQTSAALLPQIPKHIRKERTTELLAISKQKQQVFFKQNIEKELVFLPEKYNSDSQLMLGYTENYIRVGVSSGTMLSPHFHKVRIGNYDIARAFCGANLVGAD